MASWSFNPFTGNLDLVGSGGSGGAVVFEGEEETFDDLPVTIGNPPVGSSYLVRTSTGVWLVNRRQAGIWIRRNNTGVRATDWEYGGDYPVNSVNGQTGNVSLTASSVGAAAVTHASTHHTGGTDAIAPSSIGAQSLFTTTTNTITGNTTITAGRALIYQVAVTGGSPVTADISLPSSGHQAGDIIVVRSVSPFTSGSVLTIKSGVGATLDTVTAANQSFRYTANGSSPNAWNKVLVDTHTHAASDVTSGTFDNARINFAAPSAIGSTTPNSGAFTTLSANNGTITASAPVLDLSQTWNNAAVTFTGLRFNITNTNSGALSLFADFQVGGTTQFSVRRDGVVACANRINMASAVNGLEVSQASNGASPVRYTVDSGGTGNGQMRPSGNVMEQLGTTTTAGQTFRLYNTFTDASNHERGFMRWSSNVLQIGTEKAGTGSARALEFQTDGTTRLTIGSTGGAAFAAGSATVPSISFSGSAVGFYQRGVGEIAFTDGNEAQMRMYANTCIFNSDFVIGWGNSTAGPTGFDTILRRDAAGTVAQLNAGNAQAYRLYNTWSGSNSWERFNLRWTSNEFIMDAEAGSSGGTLRGIKIGSATSSLLGFYGATPVDRPATVADPTGGGTVDAEARTAINDIIDRLQELGLIA